MPPRIAFIDHALQTGGAQKSLTELLERLDPARYEPILVHSRDAHWAQAPDLAEVKRHPVFAATSLFDLRREGLGGGPLALLRYARQLTGPSRRAAKVIRETGACLVHTNSPKSHIIGGVAARLAHRPLVWHVRDIMQGRALGVLRSSAVAFHAHIVAISQAVADQFSGLGRPITVIRNGIPLDRFAPGSPSSELRAELALPPGVPLIATVGRLTPWKGHRTLLQALARLRLRGRDVMLLIVGEAAFWEPAYEGELRTYCEELGVSDSVRWLGHRDDVPDLLRLASIFCLPSANEPFGRAIVEAMAVGLPVVACQSGGVPEVVAAGETGLLVPNASPEALADALDALLADPPKAMAMGRAGEARARALFDAARVACEVQKLYDDILGRRRPADSG